MKRNRLLSILLPALLIALGLALPARATDPLTSAITAGTSEFMKGVAEQFKSSPTTTAALKAVGIKEEELPLLFMIAQASNKRPEEIALQRKSGKSWNDIMVANKVSPETIYAPATGPVGPPYGNAYGYFRNRQQKDWKNIKLTDAEAVGLANVKYLSQRHKVPPEEVIRRKTAGKSFATVDEDIEKDKQKAKAQAAQGQGNGPGNSQGRGNSGNAHGNSGNAGGPGNSQGNGNAGGNGRGPKR